jgi:radical SAM protein with 4Fe4S-binding SPASM domain
MKLNSGLHIVEIEITNRCNLNCKHCYVDRTNPRDLDSTKVYELIDELSDLGVYRLVFTGGEPLLVKEVFEFAKYAKLKGIKQVVLMTNGLLINDNNIKDIKNFDLVQLSIDMPPGDKPSFRLDYLQKLEELIRLLKKNNINVTLQATLHRSLVPSLNKLSDFAENLGVSLGINRLVLVGNAKNLEAEKLNPSELRDALSKITNIKKINKLIRCSDPLIFITDEDRLKSFESLPKKTIMGGCIAGISTLYIDSKGDVLACPFLKCIIANVFKENIEKIWFENKMLLKLRDRKNFEGKCGKCKYNSFCGGCRGASFLKTGSLIDSDPNCWL